MLKHFVYKLFGCIEVKCVKLSVAKLILKKKKNLTEQSVVLIIVHMNVKLCTLS